MYSVFRLFATALLSAVITLAAGIGYAQDAPAVIENGKRVSFTYTLSSAGEVIEANTEADPVVYIQGSGRILPALEAQLAGMQVGEEKSVSLKAADAYGEINEEAFQEVPLEMLPEDARVAGAMVQAQGFPGPIRVAEVGEKVAVLDFNHPLAGKDLTFDILIVGIDTPEAEAIAPVPAAEP